MVFTRKVNGRGRLVLLDAASMKEKENYTFAIKKEYPKFYGTKKYILILDMEDILVFSRKKFNC